MLAQHLAHTLRAFKARMRPQHARVRILFEDALDGINIRMRVQNQFVLLRQLHHQPRHRRIGIGAEHMKLTDRHIAIFFQPLLQIRGDGLILEPRADVAARAIGAQRRQNQIRRFGVQLLIAIVVGARHQRAFYASLAQQRNRFFRRHALPRVLTVMHMRVENRQHVSGLRWRLRMGMGRRQHHSAQQDFMKISHGESLAGWIAKLIHHKSRQKHKYLFLLNFFESLNIHASTAV